MTRYEDLRLVDDELEARRFFEEQEDYDYTASPKRGRITTYYKRGEDKGHPLRQEDLLSDGTGLLDLLDLLAVRNFFFVLSSNRMCGFVHFSDLNDELVKLPLFVLLAAVERRLWRKVREGLTEAELGSALVPERLDEVLGRFEEAKEQRADRVWRGCCTSVRSSSSPRILGCFHECRATIVAVLTTCTAGLRTTIAC